MVKEIGFFEKVYQVAEQIPYGRVTSYGAIAKYLGTPKSHFKQGSKGGNVFSLHVKGPCLD